MNMQTPILEPARIRAARGEAHQAIPIQPVARDLTAIWTPRKWLLGLPALVDESDLSAWMAWARPGFRCSYHVGRLDRDRRIDPDLDTLARAVLLRSSATINGTSACGHLRAVWQGSGDVEPSQVRTGPRNFLYLVQRS